MLKSTVEKKRDTQKSLIKEWYVAWWSAGKQEKDLPIEEDLGQFEEFMAHLNTGWPVANLNHPETLL